jgi:hypothetical protein
LRSDSRCRSCNSFSCVVQGSKMTCGTKAKMATGRVQEGEDGRWQEGEDGRRQEGEDGRGTRRWPQGA